MYKETAMKSGFQDLDNLFHQLEDGLAAAFSEVPLRDLLADLRDHHHPVQPTFVQTNLISDGFVPAQQMDANLINPWGVAFSPTSPFWIADNNSGLASIEKVAGGVSTTNAIPPITIAPPSPDAGPA